MDFHHLRAPVEARFNAMTKLDLFCVEVHGDELWERYLASFPPGSDPIYLKRTQHDCNCCKKFIRDVGGVVALKDGKLTSIWDITSSEPAYQAVANAMAELVKSRAIKEPFLHYEKQVGTEKSRKLVDGKTVETFSHFFAQIPWRPNTGRTYFMAGKDIATALGKAIDLRNLFLRGLTTLTQDALDTVLELIAEKSLYRGEQYEGTVKAFSAKKAEFAKLPEGEQRELYAWAHYDKLHPPVAGIRNTAIGTLLIDLSEGVDADVAVRKFEKTVAPENYQRPTSVVSQAMVNKARETIAQLGLLESMDRRHARLSDVSIENVLWADRGARKIMEGDIFDGVATKVSTNVKNLDKVETIGVDAFLRDVLPKAETIEVMLENKHAGNLMSLIAPKHASAKPLFKWGNGFSWTYNGEVADSMIKERVKRAGGNVTGDLCCRLSWSNYDDLDFHMVESPNRIGKYEIYYGNRSRPSPSGGMLDVDMNAGGGHTREPVENIVYADRRTMKEGEYLLYVHQFARREATNVGFEVEIDWLGEVQRFSYQKPLKTGENVAVARMRYTAAKGIEFVESLASTPVSREVWGLKTQDFHRVSTVMLSPNYWTDGNGTGNKHWFFMLDGANNTDRPRGFFNEFLVDELAPHRKVIEIVGSKAKVEPSADQLSGLGFPSTQRNELLARVKGSFTRTVRIAF